MSKEILFSDLREKILERLQCNLRSNPPLGEPEGFKIIDGFMPLPLYRSLSENIVLGGPFIPMVGVVGSSSGRIYHFALKSILPEVAL